MSLREARSEIAAKRADSRTSFPLVGCVELVGVVIEIAREGDVLLAAHLREGAPTAGAPVQLRLRNAASRATAIGCNDRAVIHERIPGERHGPEMRP